MIYGENLKITFNEQEPIFGSANLGEMVINGHEWTGTISFMSVPSWEDANEWSLLADPNAPLVKFLTEQVIFRQYANRLNWHRPRRKISWRHLTRTQKAAALDFYLGE